MTRECCEKVIIEALEMIELVAKAYNPAIKQINMAICENNNFAFTIDEDHNYLIDVYVRKDG